MRIYMLIYMLKGLWKEHAKFSAKLNYICLFTSIRCRGESVNVSFVIGEIFYGKSNNNGGFLNKSAHFG